MTDIITLVFSVTWSFRNHSNIMIWCSRNIYDYCLYWKQLCCVIFFVKNMRLWGLDFWWKESWKSIEIYCNIIIVFTVTSDQFNASLKILISSKRNPTDTTL